MIGGPAQRIVGFLVRGLGYRDLDDWQSAEGPAGEAVYRLVRPPRPGWYLLSLRLMAEQSRTYALCNGSQGRVLLQGRLRRRLVRIRSRHTGLWLCLQGLNGQHRIELLRLAPLLPGRPQRLLDRKLRRLHPAYGPSRLGRGLQRPPSLARRWRDYNRLLARRAPALLGYDHWIETLERPALRRAWQRLSASASPTAPLRLLPWLFQPTAIPADPGLRTASLASLASQWLAAQSLLEAAEPSDAPPPDDPELWVLALEAGSLLAPQALHRFGGAIVDHPEALLLYSDEDRMTSGGQRHSPQFKPAWNPDLLLSDPGYSHGWLIRADLCRRAWLALQRAQQAVSLHTLALEVGVRCKPHQIVHLPEVLLHRPGPIGEVAAGSRGDAASAAAVQAFLARCGQSARVTARPGGGHHLHWAVPQPPPLVSVIIPGRDRAELLGRCLASLEPAAAPPACEWLLIDNGSSEPASLAQLAALERRPGVRVLRRPGPFNYAALNNDAARLARGEVLALVNNDVEAVSPDWLAQMVAQASRPGIGAVGALLLYDDRTVQHGGVLLGIGGVAGHAHKYLPGSGPGYQLRLRLAQNLSAVTAAVLVIRRDRFLEVGGFDADTFAVNYNDVDLCLRLMAAGYRNLWCPDAVLLHHESRSRGVPSDPASLALWQRERQAMLSRWGDLLQADPHYSPQLSLLEENFSLAMRDPLAAPRSGAFPGRQG